MLLNSSHILALPSPTTSPWTLRSIRGLERLPQHLLASLHESGPTPNWQWRPRWSCTMPVLSAHWCTAVRRGPHMPDRRKDSVPSTWEASAVSLAYPGKTECPTPRSCPELTFRAQIAQAALAGACLPHGGWPHPKRHSLWRVGIWKEIQRPPTTARETWKHLTSTPIPGRTLQPTAWCGEAPWTSTSRQGKRSWWMQKQEERPIERSTTTLTDQRPHTNATFAAEICFSYIGLNSHKGCCNNRTDTTTRIYSHDQTWSKEAIYILQSISWTWVSFWGLLDKTNICGWTPVWMTLTFTEGHRLTRQLECVQSFYL